MIQVYQLDEDCLLPENDAQITSLMWVISYLGFMQHLLSWWEWTATYASRQNYHLGKWLQLPRLIERLLPGWVSDATFAHRYITNLMRANCYLILMVKLLAWRQECATWVHPKVPTRWKPVTTWSSFRCYLLDVRFLLPGLDVEVTLLMRAGCYLWLTLYYVLHQDQPLPRVMQIVLSAWGQTAT